ncbi:MAG: aminotransferase class V-fold PLP-dependent enzyme [Nocardioides sp.]|nr:aminotransferase class V-fold PLP-dependent enzyme [Nocardioides sp.]
MTERALPVTPLSLRDERAEALDHGLALLRQAWASFDEPRPHQPPVAPERHELFGSPLPETGTGVREALDAADRVLDESLAQARPRFFGYVGSSGLESAVLADALAMSHDVNLAAEAAAAHLVEQQTLGWVAQLVGYPAAGGTVTSGGMVSNLTALMAARTRAFPESRVVGVDASRVAVYASAEAHSSVERAVEVLGLGSSALRDVPIDGRRRMDPAALASAIAADRAVGVTPMAVVATAGTTLTGSVDPIGAIADVVEGTGAWLHVDGAYGLPAACTDVAGHLFAGLDRADSVSVDAHKWLFVPKACGILLVRDPAALRAAFRHDASYMVEEEGYVHPVDTTMEYSRPFRALKLWTALRAHGAGAFREAITTTIELARELADLVRARPGLELLVDAPELSTVPFRRVPARGDADAHNRSLARALQEDGRVYVTSAVVDGVTCLRPCVVNFRTTRADIESLVDLADELGRVLESG